MASAVAASSALRTTGAGCVCIAVDDDGRLCMLLGREREIAGWREGSNRWSAFSGKAEAGEEACHTAAREFLEESLGLVVLSQHSWGRSVVTAQQMEAVISQESLGTVEHVVQGRRALCRNILYLLRVPFDRYLPLRFRGLRSALETLECCLCRYRRLRKEAMHAPGICFPGATPSARLVVSRSCLQKGNLCEVTLWDVETHEVSAVTFLLNDEQVEEVRHLLDAWESTVHQLRRTPEEVLRHPAVRVYYAERQIVGARVNQAYLEKNDVAWWRVSDLADICGHRNGPRAERFRSYFLDLLPHVLELLRTGHSVTHNSEAKARPAPPPPLRAAD